MKSDESVRLTSLSSCAGCAAKLGQNALSRVLRSLPLLNDPRVLVNSATGDDAGVFQLDSKRALVQTLDFFTPIVDDPYTYGQIAATNALSDVYAMGGRPITAMNILAVPADKISPAVIAKILRGGATKARDANCSLIGGHTIRNAEPIYGLSVTGLVHPRKLMTNANAGPGDLLVLTKPLGTGIITTGIKRGLTSPALANKAIRSMRHLNVVGAELAEAGLVRAATDVTGFGLMGHLGSMCRASGVGAVIDADKIPVFSPEVLALIEDGCVPGGSQTNQANCENFVDWNNAVDNQKTLLTDAQTSGGLLLCVRPSKLSPVMSILNRRRTLAMSIIGTIIKSKTPRIAVS